MTNWQRVAMVSRPPEVRCGDRGRPNAVERTSPQCWVVLAVGGPPRYVDGPRTQGAGRDRTAFLYRHTDLACGYLCLASQLVTGRRSPSAGYRLTTDEERVVRPCIMVVWVDVRLRRRGVARQLVDAAARHAGVTLSDLEWAEPFTDSGYHLAHSVAPDGLWIADYN